MREIEIPKSYYLEKWVLKKGKVSLDDPGIEKISLPEDWGRRIFIATTYPIMVSNDEGVTWNYIHDFGSILNLRNSFLVKPMRPFGNVPSLTGKPFAYDKIYDAASPPVPRGGFNTDGLPSSWRVYPVESYDVQGNQVYVNDFDIYVFYSNDKIESIPEMPPGEINDNCILLPVVRRNSPISRDESGSGIGGDTYYYFVNLNTDKYRYCAVRPFCGHRIAQESFSSHKIMSYNDGGEDDELCFAVFDAITLTPIGAIIDLSKFKSLIIKVWMPHRWYGWPPSEIIYYVALLLSNHQDFSDIGLQIQTYQTSFKKEFKSWKELYAVVVKPFIPAPTRRLRINVRTGMKNRGTTVAYSIHTGWTRYQYVEWERTEDSKTGYDLYIDQSTQLVSSTAPGDDFMLDDDNSIDGWMALIKCTSQKLDNIQVSFNQAAGAAKVDVYEF